MRESILLHSSFEINNIINLNDFFKNLNLEKKTFLKCLKSFACLYSTALLLTFGIVVCVSFACFCIALLAFVYVFFKCKLTGKNKRGGRNCNSYAYQIGG